MNCLYLACVQGFCTTLRRVCISAFLSLESPATPRKEFISCLRCVAFLGTVLSVALRPITSFNSCVCVACVCVCVCVFGQTVSI